MNGKSIFSGFIRQFPESLTASWIDTDSEITDNKTKN